MDTPCCICCPATTSRCQSLPTFVDLDLLHQQLLRHRSAIGRFGVTVFVLRHDRDRVLVLDSQSSIFGGISAKAEGADVSAVVQSANAWALSGALHYRRSLNGTRSTSIHIVKVTRGCSGAVRNASYCVSNATLGRLVYVGGRTIGLYRSVARSCQRIERHLGVDGPSSPSTSGYSVGQRTPGPRSRP